MDEYRDIMSRIEKAAEDYARKRRKKMKNWKDSEKKNKNDEIYTKRLRKS